MGKQIKKFKKKDFADQSAVIGATLYSDDRVKFLSYNPVKYPYTLEYKSEVEYRTTAFVPVWKPIDDFYLAVEHSEYQINNPSAVPLKTKANNFELYGIQMSDEQHLVAKNLKALKYEAYSPPLKAIIPSYRVALEKFSMEGVDGYNKDWDSFGRWMQNDLLKGTDDIPETAVKEVQDLTQGVLDPLERARIVYNYVQEKTRYISVQIGIGGWKPINASEIDQLGYGDCKGLTNYTRALLDAVSVPSYYTVVYGDRDITDIDKDFSSTEGNHAILSIPVEDEYVFL
jgi:transglutaminase-like putative cysteine protease